MKEQVSRGSAERTELKLSRQTEVRVQVVVVTPHLVSCSPSSFGRRPLPCVSKEYSFVPGAAEEPQGPEETVIFCEIKGDDDTAFPTLPVSYEQRVSWSLSKREGETKCALILYLNIQQLFFVVFLE